MISIDSERNVSAKLTFGDDPPSAVAKLTKSGLAEPVLAKPVLDKTVLDKPGLESLGLAISLAASIRIAICLGVDCLVSAATLRSFRLFSAGSIGSHRA